MPQNKFDLLFGVSRRVIHALAGPQFQTCNMMGKGFVGDTKGLSEGLRVLCALMQVVFLTAKERVSPDPE